MLYTDPTGEEKGLATEANAGRTDEVQATPQKLDRNPIPQRPGRNEGVAKPARSVPQRPQVSQQSKQVQVNVSLTPPVQQSAQESKAATPQHEIKQPSHESSEKGKQPEAEQKADRQKPAPPERKPIPRVSVSTRQPVEPQSKSPVSRPPTQEAEKRSVEPQSKPPVSRPPTQEAEKRSVEPQSKSPVSRPPTQEPGKPPMPPESQSRQPVHEERQRPSYPPEARGNSQPQMPAYGPSPQQPAWQGYAATSVPRLQTKDRRFALGLVSLGVILVAFLALILALALGVPATWFLGSLFLFVCAFIVIVNLTYIYSFIGNNR
ncbi:hypothetical protein EI42_04839 [Thermosporothrix hazakensis]|jgi:hypothetical protein|uniref:Uncharacterized protein n=1 Tax=Thermosporothrix hazakensis TaxID=644383 RepID=A0A326U1I4_THEHA|nr:hypothetical protein [Thermosporothrix hazakensis]PZW23914.1 hypothetical protein EI42_04839 [Thermosporothrix hazakensis]GCE48488.1 hypothetical protein KTH_33570 [Thermosporothrix hazakensis]